MFYKNGLIKFNLNLILKYIKYLLTFKIFRNTVYYLLTKQNK